MPFPVLLDSDGAAAGIVGTGKLGVTTLVRPAQVIAGAKSFAAGNRQGKPGARPLQLGATIVIDTNGDVLYEDREEFAGDHADIDDILVALGG